MSQTSIPLNWTIGLGKEEAKNFTEILLNSSILTTRIVDLLEETLQSLEDAEENEKNFLAPDFPYRQAYLLGRKKELKKLLKLFDFRQKKEKV